MFPEWASLDPVTISFEPRIKLCDGSVDPRENPTCHRLNQNISLLHRLTAEVTRLFDLGGEGFNSRHDPPLFGEWRERDCESEKALLLQANTVGGSFARLLAHVYKFWRTAHPAKKRR